MKKSLKLILLASLALLTCALMFTACDSGQAITDKNDGTSNGSTNNIGNQNEDTHVHTFDAWVTVKEATYTETGIQERTCSCGEKEQRTLEKLVAKSTVTASEWKQAFDFSSVQELTLGIDETTVDEYGTMSINGIVKCSAEEAYMNYILVYNGEEEVVQEYDGGEPLVDFGSAVLGDTMRGFWNEINGHSDLGYLQFNYDEQSASYYATVAIYGVPCNVNLFFESGRIVKLTIVSVANADETINGTYTYSYN